MMPAMRSLFLKIFLWFWVTVIVTGIALVATWIILQPKNVPSQSQTNLADTAWASGFATVNVFEQQGAPAALAYMEQLRQRAHLKACLFDVSGRAIAGDDCATFDDIVPRASASDTPPFNTKHGFLRIAVKVRGRSGRQYIYASEATEHRGPPPGVSHLGIVLRNCVALLVSGFICYLLTLYLTAPILRLREASQQLAQGNLSTRAAAGMEKRRDELGTLVRDFNTMAGRIEELVSRQRQLFYDISHELRSPLARLNVALDLGRERKGDDPAFEHMEQDIGRLDEMIGRLLTIARLDASTVPVEMTHVDLSELVAQVVRSADFELRERDGSVKLTSRGQYFVRGNAELLHSAVENVVRNAIRYTGNGNPVEVNLGATDERDQSSVRIAVHDYGIGVPETELTNIFLPFYRVADDRNRQSGGTGLGLAIAERVVRIHGGSIRAQNITPHGLEIEILLPRVG